MGIVCLSSLTNRAAAHPIAGVSDDPRAPVILDLYLDGVSRSVSAGYPDSFGLFALIDREMPTYHKQGGADCVRANFVALDVDDTLMFDGEGDAELALRLFAPSATRLLISHDANGNASPIQEVAVAPSHALQDVRVTLPEARFAGRGMETTDIAIAAFSTIYPDERFDAAFTLCGGSVQIDGMQNKTDGEATLSVRTLLDGVPTPVRIGVYDDRGAALASSNSALPVQYFSELISTLQLRDFTGGAKQFWPHENRYYQYSDGVYDLSAHAGDLTIVVSKGPAIEPIVKTVTLLPDQDLKLEIDLERVGQASDFRHDMWFSGDLHVHLDRRMPWADPQITKPLQAEGLNITHVLEVWNLARRYFPQYDLSALGRRHIEDHILSPGVEGPRTALFGHIIAVNLTQPVLNAGRNTDYHDTLAAYRQQGALIGFAHVGSGEFNDALGLALLVPEGVIDFVEILQNSRLQTDLWYDYLNIGERLSPSAGSDHPYFDQPGSMMNYILLSDGLTASGWLEGVRDGRMFITTGPLLDVTIDGAEIGSAIQATAEPGHLVSGWAGLAAIRGGLVQVDILRCGSTVHTLRPETPASGIKINVPVDLSRPGWFAVKAVGADGSVAHTGAFFVEDRNGDSACHEAASPSLARITRTLNELEALTPDPDRELEYWESGDLDKLFQSDKDDLRSRLEYARAYYTGAKRSSINSISLPAKNGEDHP